MVERCATSPRSFVRVGRSDVRPCLSISCSRRPLPTRRRRVGQVSWLTRDRRPSKAAKSKLSLRHNSYMTSLMSIPSSQRRTTRTCRTKYRYSVSQHSCLRVSFLEPQLSEAEFWKRYFQSKLFHSHRASIRSTATQHVVKDDAIFDKYLEKPDDGESFTLAPLILPTYIP